MGEPAGEEPKAGIPDYIASLKKEFEVGRKWSETTSRLVVEKFQKMDAMLSELAEKLKNYQAPAPVELVVQALPEEKNDEPAPTLAPVPKDTGNQFLIRMSHDLRTPMTVIMGMAEMLENTGLSKEQAGYLESLISAGEHLLGVITNMLDFSLIGAEGVELQPGSFDLRDLVEEVSKLMAFQAHEKGLELNCYVTQDVLTSLKGDKGRLQQLLVNLLHSSIHNTSEGEVTLQVQRDEAQSGSVLFKVSDTSTRFDAKAIKAMLDDTPQDMEMSREYSETGIHLLICSLLAKILGGRIWVVENGQGQAVCISLPFEEGSPVDRTYRPDLSGLKGLKVMVVDDNATNRLIFTEYLTMWGARVVEAENEESALVAVAKAAERGAPYKLVLLDYLKPEIDGLKLARRLIDLETPTPAMIMMFNSSDGNEGKMSARELGITNHLVKPVKRVELLSEVLSVLGQSKEETDAGRVSLESTAGVLPPLRILLVDDYAPNREIVELYLKSTPVSVESANNGMEAIKKFRPGKYNVILLDLEMPEMDGLAAAKAMREMEMKYDRPQTPIICLSAHVLPEHREKATEAGCTDFVKKPIRKRDLLNALWKCVLEGGHTLIATNFTMPPPETEDGPEAEAKQPDVDENIITVDENLRDVVAEFMRTLRQECHSLVTALKKKDFDTVLSIAKEVKAAGAGYELNFVTEAGIDIANLVQKKKPKAIFDRTKKLYDFIKHVKVQARKSRSGSTGSQGETTDQETFLVNVDEELEHVIDDYIQAVKKDCRIMGMAYTQDDLDKVFMIAHDLKGSGGAYGLDRVTEIGSRICSLIRNKIREPIAGQIEQLNTYINNVQVVSH